MAKGTGVIHTYVKSTIQWCIHKETVIPNVDLYLALTRLPQEYTIYFWSPDPRRSSSSCVPPLSFLCLEAGRNEYVDIFRGEVGA